jgi:hypothetical protein
MDARFIGTLAALALVVPAGAGAATIQDRLLASTDDPATAMDALAGSLVWAHASSGGLQHLVWFHGNVTDQQKQTSRAAIYPRLGRNAAGGLVVTYRRCDNAGCGLYELDLAAGQEIRLPVPHRRGCVEDHPAITGGTVVFGRSCAGHGSGLFGLHGRSTRAILRLDGYRVADVTARNGRVAAAITRRGRGYLGTVPLSGRGGFTIFYDVSFLAGQTSEIGSLAMSDGFLYWRWLTQGENGTTTLIYRAELLRRAPCEIEHRIGSSDTGIRNVAGTIDALAVDGIRLYYALGGQGIFEARQPPPSFRVVGSASRHFGRGCHTYGQV